MTALTVALAVLAQAAAGTPDAGAEAGWTVLHAVPLESALKGPVGWASAELVVTLADVKAPPAFLTRRGLRADASGSFTVGALDEVRATDKPSPAVSKPSWVIDYDQPAFTPVFARLHQVLGEKPTPAELTEFAARYLDKKSYDRGFDLASQVAERRGGDCTEHGVFLAALLRHAGVPARAVLGLVLVATDGKPQAFGHLWVEAFVDGAWRVFDAALPSSLSRVYLPAGVLANEGPGYTLSLASGVMALRFTHLELRARR